MTVFLFVSYFNWIILKNVKLYNFKLTLKNLAAKIHPTSKFYQFSLEYNIVSSMRENVLFQNVEKSVPFKKVKVHYIYSVIK